MPKFLNPPFLLSPAGGFPGTSFRMPLAAGCILQALPRPVGVPVSHSPLAAHQGGSMPSGWCLRQRLDLCSGLTSEHPQVLMAMLLLSLASGEGQGSQASSGEHLSLP